MQEWEYTFDPVTKADWYAQIEKELKGKSIASLQKEWWPGESLFPLHHFEETTREPVVLPERLFQSPPKLIEFADTLRMTDDEVNARLMEALISGAQQFILQIHGNTRIPFRLWTKDIHAEMVQWHFYPQDIGSFDLDRIPEEAKDTLCVRIPRAIRESTADSLSIVIRKIKASPGLPLKFEYTFPSKGNWTEGAASVFRSVLSDLREWKNSGASALEFFNQCILCVDSDTDYFKLLIQIRVLHLVWHNLFAYYIPDEGIPTGYLECHIHPEGGEKPEQYLIRSSMSSLAAVLAGSSGLCIHHAAESGTPAFYRRINRNVHHLLEMESGLPRSQDVMAGAIAIDYYTRRWTEQIWDKLSLE